MKGLTTDCYGPWTLYPITVRLDPALAPKIDSQYKSQSRITIDLSVEGSFSVNQSVYQWNVTIETTECM